MTNEEMALVLEAHARATREIAAAVSTDREKLLNFAHCCESGAAALRAMEWKPIADAPPEGV